MSLAEISCPVPSLAEKLPGTGIPFYGVFSRGIAGTFAPFDRRRYTGTENGISPHGLVRHEELIPFSIPSTRGKFVGVPFYVFFSRGVTDTFKVVSFDRNRYTGTENGVTVYHCLGCCGSQELSLFHIP